MPANEASSAPRGGPNLRRPVPIRAEAPSLMLRAAAPWLMMSVAVIVEFAVGLVTFPSPTRAVSAAIQRDSRPEVRAIDPSTTSAVRPVRPVVLPATMALPGSDARFRVNPHAWSTRAAHRPTDPSVVSWWMTGQRAGAPGGPVTTGHARSATGEEALPAFDRLEQGDLILLTVADGDVHHDRVTERRRFSPTGLASSLLADRESSLLLISFAGRPAAAGPNDTHHLITAGEVGG